MRVSSGSGNGVGAQEPGCELSRVMSMVELRGSGLLIQLAAGAVMAAVHFRQAKRFSPSGPTQLSGFLLLCVCASFRTPSPLSPITSLHPWIRSYELVRGDLTTGDRNRALLAVVAVPIEVGSLGEHTKACGHRQSDPSLRRGGLGPRTLTALVGTGVAVSRTVLPNADIAVGWADDGRRRRGRRHGDVGGSE